MVVKSLKSLLILFSKNCTFSYIQTDLLYRYRFSVFVLIPCIGTVFLIVISTVFITWHTTTCHYLIPDSCVLSPDTCLISLITCHLIYSCLPCIIIFQESYPAIMYYIQWLVFLVLMYAWTRHALVIPVIWYCILINYKKTNLYRVRGESDGFQEVNMFIVVLGMLCNSNFRIYPRPPGVRREHWLPTSCYIPD